MIMTRRERVLAAIAHEETDRIPVDLGGMRSTGLTAIAYGRLNRYWALEPRDGGWVVRHADGTVIGEMPAGAFYLNQKHFPLLDWDGDPRVLDRLPELMGKGP